MLGLERVAVAKIRDPGDGGVRPRAASVGRCGGVGGRCAAELMAGAGEVGQGAPDAGDGPHTGLGAGALNQQRPDRVAGRAGAATIVQPVPQLVQPQRTGRQAGAGGARRR